MTTKTLQDVTASDLMNNERGTYVALAFDWLHDSNLIPWLCPTCGSDDINCTVAGQSATVSCREFDCDWTKTLHGILDNSDFEDFVCESDDFVLFVTDGDGF